jgi:hydroxyacyl-ACP dehydratase HTD2-like protein with hotdog domain
MFLSIPFDWEVPMDICPRTARRSRTTASCYPPLKARRKLFGGYQVEYFQEIRPGDVLTRQRKILDIYERSGGERQFGLRADRGHLYQPARREGRR